MYWTAWKSRAAGLLSSRSFGAGGDRRFIAVEDLLHVSVGV